MIKDFDSALRFAEAEPAIAIESPYTWTIMLDAMAVWR